MSETRATAAVIDYTIGSGLDRFPSEAVSLAKQCIIDGLGVKGIPEPRFGA